MARFDRQIQTALRLIKKNGQKATWRTIDDADPSNPSQPWNPGPANPVDNDAIICFLPIDRQTMETFNFIKGTEVPKGSVMGLMGQVKFEPNLKDVVIRDGVEMRISSIDVLSPNGQKILYTMVFQA